MPVALWSGALGLNLPSFSFGDKNNLAISRFGVQPECQLDAMAFYALMALTVVHANMHSTWYPTTVRK